MKVYVINIDKNTVILKNYNSGEIAMRPETACKICYKKMEKSNTILTHKALSARIFNS